jgi:hypothetical protein
MLDPGAPGLDGWPDPDQARQHDKVDEFHLILLHA